MGFGFLEPAKAKIRNLDLRRDDGNGWGLEWDVYSNEKRLLEGDKERVEFSESSESSSGMENSKSMKGPSSWSSSSSSVEELLELRIMLRDSMVAARDQGKFGTWQEGF